MSKPATVLSATARYVDQLQRQTRCLKPVEGRHWGHLITGGTLGAGLSLWFSIGLFKAGTFSWFIPILAAIVGALGFAWLARRLWNHLLANCLRQQQDLARTNLFEHDLLLVCMQDELPAKFEKLRFVAQSYGKTRAANWAELRKGSMQQRVQWLVENYEVVCAALKLPSVSPELRHVQSRLCRWLWLPAGLFVLSIALIYMQEAGRIGGGMLLAVNVMGLSFAWGGIVFALVVIAGQLQRAAFLSVLVEAIDLTED